MPLTLVRNLSNAECGDIASFEKLARDSHRQAYGFAYRLTGSAADAEDLVQEAYVRAYRFFGRYDARLPFTNWIYRIMANAHVDTVRRRGKVKTSSLDQASADGRPGWDVADHEAGPESLLLGSTLEEPLQSALQAMNPEFRAAVALADLEGMSYEEVAEAMGTSVGTVRSRIHRGRRQIRNHLAKHFPAEFARMRVES